MIAETTHTEDFEQLYLSLREKEGRIYTDEELLHLPVIQKHHPHFAEWQIRKESYLRLRDYLCKSVFPMKILEVGCGNGWLSHRLSSLPLVDITGFDINSIELKQAKRVFDHISNLHFVDDMPEEPGQFDHIVFASSIQYFSSAKEIIEVFMQQLRPNGEIHLIDTAFYKQEEIAAAKERTAGHFNRSGFPEMSSFYFHHSWEELTPFRYEIKYQPSFVRRRFYNNKNPFPWICIRKT